jgi:hypothetical protein
MAKKSIKPMIEIAPTREDYLVREQHFDWARAKRISDMPVIDDQDWCCVCGTALVDDLFNWRSILTEDEALTEPSEAVQGLIEEACEAIRAGSESLALEEDSRRSSRRSIAYSVLNGISHLAAFALTQKGAREIILEQLARDLEFQARQQKGWGAYNKQAALDIHHKEPKLTPP